MLLGASSLDELLDRIETANRVSDQDATTLGQVIRYRAQVKRERIQLKQARVAQARDRRDEGVAEGFDREPAPAAPVDARRDSKRDPPDPGGGAQALARDRRQACRARPFPARRRRLGAAGVTPDGAVVAPPSRYGGVVGIAMRYLGVPYRWGGASPSGFDCSGFTMYVFAQIGVSLPHYTAPSGAWARRSSRDQLEAGDLVFFNGLGHMGIYIGGDNFIHSPHTGDVVKISSMTGWYSSTYVGARRL